MSDENTLFDRTLVRGSVGPIPSRLFGPQPGTPVSPGGPVNNPPNLTSNKLASTGTNPVFNALPAGGFEGALTNATNWIGSNQTAQVFTATVPRGQVFYMRSISVKIINSTTA